jgi:hypothetical protein
MDQWRERLAAFLDLPSGSIGQFGGGKNKRTGVIDVAVIQSLQRKGNVEDFFADYGRLLPVVLAGFLHWHSAIAFSPPTGGYVQTGKQEGTELLLVCRHIREVLRDLSLTKRNAEPQ